MSFPERVQTTPTVLPIAAGTWEIDPDIRGPKFLDAELGELDHVDQVRVRGTGTVDRTSVGLARLPKLVIGHTVTVTVSALYVHAR